MAGFNPNEYFKNKLHNVGTDKIQALHEATTRKIESLGNYHAQIEQERKADQDSWVNQLGVNPDSFTGETVDLAAHAAYGLSRMVGEIAAIPFHAQNFDSSWLTQQHEVDAYNRYLKGEATPDDFAILNSRKVLNNENSIASSMGSGKDQAYRDAQAPTVLERFEEAKQARQRAADIRKFFDISGIKHKGDAQAFQEALTEGFDPAWEQTKQGAASLWGGETLKGASDLASGTGKLAKNVGNALVDAPMGAFEAAVENLPQLATGLLGKTGKAAMLASNLGYAGDNYVEGIQNYEKANDGQLPSTEVQAEKALKAASLAGAEQLGDMIGLDLITTPGKKVLNVVRKGAAEVADTAEDAIRTGFKEALKNVTKASGEGFLSEAATEGYQTAVEGDVLGKPASAKDIFIGSVLGGLSGGMLSGGGRAMAEIAQATPEHQEEKAKEAKSFIKQAEAIQSGDVSTYLDPKTSSYAPSKAIAALHGNNQLETTTEETKSANQAKAEEILSGIQSERDQVADLLSMRNAEAVATQIQEVEAELASMPEGDPLRADYQEELAFLQEQQKELQDNPPAAKDTKKLESRLEFLDRELKQSQQAMKVMTSQGDAKASIEADLSLLASTEEDNTPEIQQAKQAAAERVLTLSMVSPEKVSPEQLQAVVENKANGLTDEQRSHLRVFSEARIAENKLKDPDKVLNDIYFGEHRPGRTQYQGIQDYKAAMAQAIRTGNQKAATRALRGLTKLANSQQGKAALAQTLFAKGLGQQMLFNPVSQQWIPAERRYSDKEMGKLGGLTLNSAKLVEKIGVGADATQKALASLQSAYAVKFGKPAPVARTSVKSETLVNSVEQPVVNSVESTAAPSAVADSSTESPVNHSTVDSSVDSVEVSTPSLQRSENAVGSTESSVMTQEETSSKEEVPEKVYNQRKPGRSASKRPDLTGAILTLTEGRGLSSTVLEDATGESKIWPRMRGKAIFPKGSTNDDLSQLLERLIEAGYSQLTPGDTNSLLELIRDHVEGNLRYPAEEEVARHAAAKAKQQRLQERAEKQRAKLSAAQQKKVEQLLKQFLDSFGDDQYAQLLQDIEDVLGDAWLDDDLIEEAYNLIQGAIESAQATQETTQVEKSGTPESASPIRQTQLGRERVADDVVSTTADAENQKEVAPTPVAETASVEAESTSEESSELPLAFYEGDHPLPEPGKATEFFTDLKNNLVATFTTQDKANPERESNRPLATVKNFFSKWMNGEVTLDGVLSEAKESGNAYWASLSDAQFDALTFMRNVFQHHWLASLKKQIKAKTLHPSFRMQDLMQDMLVNGELDENTLTAMMASGYQWVLEKANAPALLTPEQINEMHGKDKDAGFDSQLYEHMQHVVGMTDMVVYSLGDSVVQSLGLKTRKEAPQNLMPNLKMALGSRVLGMLIEQGMVDVQSVPYNTVAQLYGEQVIPENSKRAIAYVRFLRNADGSLKAKAKQIRDSNVGAGNVIERLFGIEKAPRMAETEASKFSQKTAKRTNQKITRMQQKALQQEMNTPYRVIPAMLDMATLLDRQRILQAAGWVDLETTPVHAVNRKAVEAKNKSLEQQYDLMLEQVTNSDGAVDFYVTQDVWSNFRAGMQQQSLNPQASKIHRTFFAHPGWEVSLDLANENQMKVFLVSAAMNLGAVKTDQQRDSQSLELFRKKLSDQAGTLEQAILNGNTPLAKAIEVVRTGLLDPEGQANTMGASDKDLVAQTAAKGEGMASLQALVALAQYKQALLDKKESFTTTMVVGADGKTNGPMLTLLALGAAVNPEALLTVLNKGGFYGEDQATHFSEFYEDPDSQDLYEDLGTAIVQRALKNQKTPEDIQAAWAVYNKAKNKKEVPVPWNYFTEAEFKATEALTKKLLEDNGKAAKAGRNLVKTPTTMFNYGSALKKAIEGMQNDFIAAYYKSLEGFAADSIKAAKELPGFIEHMNVLLKKGSSKTVQPSMIPANVSVDELMKQELSKDQEQALRNAFNTILGKPAEASMKSKFAVLIERRRTLNQSINAAFTLYNLAYQEARQRKREELMASGEIPVHVQEKGMDVGKRTSIADLNEVHEQEIRESLKHLLPVIQSAASQQENNLEAGIYLSKHQFTQQKSPMYKVQANLGVEMNTGDARGTTSSNLHTYGMTVQEIDPGAAGLALAIQSTDSAIMHNTLNHVPETLNVHDEGNNSVLKIVDTARELNKQTVKHLLDYSPAREVMSLLERQLAALVQGVEDKTIDPKVVAQVMDHWASVLNQYRDEDTQLTPQQALQTMVQVSAENAYGADKQRLEVIAQLRYVDQYTWEGGQYPVSQAIRDEASKRLEAMKDTLPVSEATAALVEKLSGFYSGEGTSIEMDPEAQDAQDEPAKVESTAEIGLPGVSALNVITATQPGIAAAVAEGMPVVEAINQQDYLTVAESVEDMARTTDALPESHTNAFGILGNPEEASDPKWVSWFEGKTEFTLQDLIKELASRTKGESNLKKFQRELLQQLYKQLPKDLRIVHVTAETPASALVGNAPITGSRGWYSVQGNSEAIYVLGQDYRHSFLTTEILLHELLHSAVASTIEFDQSLAVKGILADLEALRSKAENFVKKNGLNDFLPAVANVQEFVAWGMTNAGFMQQVLNNPALNSKAKTRKNELVSAFKKFAQALVGLLFKNTEKSSQEVTVSGMTNLIHNVSGLLAQAQRTDRNPGAEIQLAMASPKASNPTTQQLYAGLDGIGLTDAFDTHLQSVLATLVDKLHGPFGSFKDKLAAQQSSDPTDILNAAIQTGVAPFASKAQTAGFNISDKELLVIEQVEATVRAALEDNEGQTTLAYRELSKLYQEARQRLSYKDFHPDWANASDSEKDQAKALYDFLFKMEQGQDGRLDYLSRFAALGLGNAQVYGLLQQSLSKETREAQTLTERLQQFLERALDWLVGKATHTYNGQLANEKLLALVNQLVGIEFKRRNQTTSKNSVLEAMEQTLRKGSQAARNAVDTVANSKLVTQSKSGIVQGVGSLASTVIGGRLDTVVGKITEVRNRFNQENQDLLSSLVNEMRGTTPFLEKLHKLHRQAKRREQQREEIETLEARSALGAFQNGKDFSKEDRDAINNVFLRTNLHVLLKSQSLSEVYKLVSNDAAREQAVAQLERQIRRFKYGMYYDNQANALAYYMATGKNASEFLIKNSQAIAYLSGTGQTILAKQAQPAVEIIEQLVALRALGYTSGMQLSQARTILAQEQQRTDNQNGVEYILKRHQALQEEALNKLFKGNPALMIEGYLPEIYDPYTDLRVADSLEGELLKSQGYSEGGEVQQDRYDVPRNFKFYILRGHSVSPWLSSMLSFTGMAARGSRAATDSVKNRTQWIDNRQDLEQLNQRKMARMRALLKGDPNYDPTKVEDVFAAPVLNEQGQVADYHYLMNSATKDDLLRRDNRFDILLGRLSASQFDKVSTPEQNRNVIQALHDQYQKDYAQNPGLYREISLDSSIKYHRDLYQMLPENTKQAIAEIFGDMPLMVRVDQLDLVFGYRKYNLGDSFTKGEDERNALEQIMVDWATHLFGVKAMVNLRRADDIWQFVVKEVKDIVVIKNITTLLNNIKSNVSLLLWAGVPVKGIVHHHRVAMTGALAYRKDTARLQELKRQLEAQYFPIDEKEMRAEVLRLEDAIQRNPVRQLLEEGMMPTIVEDVDSSDDIYSYKAHAREKTDKLIKKLHPTVVKGAKQIYMAHDTSMYRSLHYVTQLSDFVGRYTLYQHLTTRQENKLSHDDAVIRASEAFVNYDRLSHKVVRGLNDRGLVWFTSYALRIQKVIASLFQDNPARALAIIAFGNYFGQSGLLTESSMINRLGNNPFSIGAFKYPGVLDELGTVKAAMTFID